MAKVKKKGAWRARVERALQALGPGDQGTADVVRQVGKSKFKRTATWPATVRRTLQEIRDTSPGQLKFKHGRRGIYESNVPTPAQQKLWDRMRTKLEADFKITGGSAYRVPFVQGGQSHAYDFTFRPQSHDLESVSETLRQAVIVLWPTYRKRVDVAVHALAVIHERDGRTSEVGSKWVTIAVALSGAANAAASINVTLEGLSAKERASYHITSELIGFTVLAAV